MPRPPIHSPAPTEAETHAKAMRAIGLMLCATVLFAGMHGTIRYVTQDLHPFEVAFFRNVVGLLVIAPYFMRYGLRHLRTGRFGLHVLRASLNVVSMLSMFMALKLAPLADVTALTFGAPIFATLLAVMLLGETVGARRWIAIGVGLAGVLVVLRPGFAEIGTGSLLALLSAFSWGCALIVIKTLCRTDSSVTITAYMMLFLAPCSLIAALPYWTWPSATQLYWMVGLGIMGTAGHLLMNQALSLAATHVVMPLDFARMIWISIIGYAIFGESLDVFAWLGGAMIFASGAFIAYREGRKKVPREADPPRP